MPFMKIIFALTTLVFAINFAVNAQRIEIKKADNFMPSSDPPKILNPENDLQVKIGGVDAKHLIPLLKADSLKYSEDMKRSFYDIALINIGSQGNETEDSMQLVQSIIDSNFSLLFQQELEGAESFDSLDLIFYDISNTANPKKITLFPKNEKNPIPEIVPAIIDDSMLRNIGGGNCQLCSIYNSQLSQPIKNRHERQYSTDYIITYDPLLENDAYSICKHIFEKRKGRLYERYRKVAPMWFAPRVGSQIRFEVINQSLDKPFKLSVDEKDVFNTGSSQFSSLISGLVTSNIMNPILKDTGSTEESATATSTAEKLNNVIPQIAKYVAAFRISSCSIRQFKTDLPVIIERITKYLEVQAITLDQLSASLGDKIRKINNDDERAAALKAANNLIAALKMMENLQPIAYTTLRAKNNDYIEIKYTDDNHKESKPENIRMSGGMKIDFSGGFVLTGLRDYSYTLKNVIVQYTPPGDNSTKRDTTGNVIVREDDGNNQVGVGIFSHFYPRISSDYNLAGAVGIMTSTNLNLRIMLGGSVLISSLFGSNNRISFTYGIVWGKVNRLSNQDADYLDRPRQVNGLPEFYSGSTPPSLISKSDHSWFFAITMNFGGR